MHLHPFVRPWVCWTKKNVYSGALLARCYFEELKIDCIIDQLKPGLKSSIFYFYLKSVLVENAPLGGSTMRVHSAYYTQGCAAAHKHAKYKKLKDYSVKEYYCVGYINIKMPTSDNG